MTSEPRGEHSAALLTQITSQAVSPVAKFKVFNTLITCIKPVGLSTLLIVFGSAVVGAVVFYI